MLLATLAIAPAGVAAPPPNDNYLQSFALNEPGSPLPRDDTIVDPTRDTTQATLQPDLFVPSFDGGPGPGGGAEPITCGTSLFGKTVWYDFYPDVHGFVQLEANGFNSGIAAMEFDRRTFRPDLRNRVCSDRSPGTNETILVKVARGRAYTVQVGGIGNVGGQLEFRLDFLADRDTDEVFDDNDRCPRLKGPAPGGCPPQLRADPTLRALPTGGGIRIVSLRVAATRGARVSVSCTRRACGRRTKRAGRRAVRFGALSGKSLRAGSKLVIRATRKGAIGRYVVYRITRGNFKSPLRRCLNPGSSKPRRRCR